MSAFALREAAYLDGSLPDRPSEPEPEERLCSCCESTLLAYQHRRGTCTSCWGADCDLCIARIREQGRMAVCAHCRSTVPSYPRPTLFVYRPEFSTDEFYDGCRGWE